MAGRHDAPAPGGPQKRLLNLGCGDTWHQDWVNLDFQSRSPAVIAYDLRLGVPFADDSADVIYHSHVLEHFTRSGGEKFLAECFRVLRPGGLMRVVAPDLENIARAYLAALEAARQGGKEAGEQHEWMTIELLDQMTRTGPGGEMAAFWNRNPVPQEDFVASRMGQEFIQYRQRMAERQPQAEHPCTPLPVVNRQFYLGGELHRWMYDSVALERLLLALGFCEVTRQQYDVSLDPDILRYGLDAAPDHGLRKPDSFFMEAIKPLRPEDTSVKVALFSTRDSGGAGIAGLRCHTSFAGTGIRSEMYVAEQHTCAPHLHILPGKGQVLRLGEGGSAVLSTLRPGESRRSSLYKNRPKGLEYFSIPQQCVDLGAVPFFDDFDLINLHWIADFLDVGMSRRFLQGRPIVWTLHDMRAFTGGCHYTGDCRKFTENCGACPQLGSTDPRDLSFETWQASMSAYRGLNMHIVAPSAWLAEEARKSSLFKRFPVHVIPYAQPLDIFKPLPREPLRRGLGIKADELVLTFVSQHLGNKRKGMEFLLDALGLIAAGPLRETVRVLLMGANPPDIFFKLGLRTEALGHLDRPEQAAAVYNLSDAVLAPSLEDNSPNVICEAAGCGVPVVAFAAGGIPEMIRHQQTGWLAPVGSAESLAEGIAWAAEARKDPALRSRCRALALETWSPQLRAADYLALFREITGK
ncbi:MAG: glycosyltransferase [Desulfovibrionaceae bacterium]|nr:glycosyltransferase [Desulfovibrionaceae bacterium]